MRSFQVKIIIRAIQVGRHYCDIVSSVLQVITLTHLDPGYLSYRIRFIRIFERRSEQAILRHRLRSISRINTSTSQKQKFLYIIQIRSMNHIVLNHKILVNKVSPVAAVCHNPSDMGCCQEHIFRLLCGKEIMNGLLIGQIQFRMRTQDEIRVTLCLQILQNSRTDQSPMACYKYFTILIHSLFLSNSADIVHTGSSTSERQLASTVPHRSNHSDKQLLPSKLFSTLVVSLSPQRRWRLRKENRAYRCQAMQNRALRAELSNSHPSGIPVISNSPRAEGLICLATSTTLFG